MKKCFALLIGILLLLILAACGGDSEPTPTDGTTPAPTTPAPTTPAPATPNNPTEPPHTHSYTSNVTAPTCTQQGYTTYTCACGDTYTADETAITDHDYQETSRVDATATKDGKVTYICSVCSDSYEEMLPATGSVGLEYEANNDGTYTVIGIGTCTDTHVVIPKVYEGAAVTAIGRRAFYDCHTIEEITIPETISEIGQQIFYKCSALHTVYYNGTYGSTENLFLNVANIKKVVFGGKTIPSCACYNAPNLTEVVILDSVTSIGSNAFRNCSSLTSVYITDIEAWCGIDFSDWSSNPLHHGAALYLNGELMTDIEIPDSVTTIGSYAFSGCSSLTSITIPDSVTTIGSYAFYNCSSLTSIEIPDSVTIISYEAFANCSSLSSVYITDIEAWCGISFSTSYSDPLRNGAALYLNGELVTDLVIPDSVTSIGSYAFYGCSSLTSIVIPDSVTSIGSYAFYGCSSLTSIVIPDSVTSIGEGAFYYCSSLTSITIPDSVTSIGSYAFYGCSSLTSITIPDGVTSIGDWAFSYCSSLTSITIPDSVTSIGKGAFVYCSSLTSITIPDGVTIISYEAFPGCSSLTSIVIPDSVIIIDNYAFSYCSSLTDIHFGGTKEQWSAIYKGYDWNDWTGNYIIHCTDGDISK